MKLPNAIAIVAALSLASVACVQAQRTTEAPTRADPNGRKSAGSTDPSAASSLPQRDAVGFPAGSDGTASGLDAKWVSALVGMKVETPAGTRLGTVRDVVVDAYGRRTYAIISYGGRMGGGNKYTAVPWMTVADMLQRDRLLVDQTQFENAPLLPSAKPDSANGSWRREADSYWRGKVALSAGSSNVPAEPTARAPASQSETPPKERR
jgi:sporulation protein YlmC with PRC-barrel domain